MAVGVVQHGRVGQPPGVHAAGERVRITSGLNVRPFARPASLVRGEPRQAPTWRCGGGPGCEGDPENMSSTTSLSPGVKPRGSPHRSQQAVFNCAEGPHISG